MSLRGLRRRRRWSQRHVGHQLGISQQWVSRLEADTRNARIGLLDRWVNLLGGYLAVEVRVNGERALADAAHATLGNQLVADLRRAGWLVEAEVSFNHYGDRGRVDVLAYHAPSRILLVVEVKTRILDLQDLLGRLDVKQRQAPKLARDRGWNVAASVPAIVVAEGRTSRRRVEQHDALFAPYALRARAARAWLRSPTLPAPSGILLFEPPRTTTRPSTPRRR